MTSRGRSLGDRLQLARKVLAAQYTQPATALWRITEAELVLERLSGAGTGLDLGCGDGTLACVLFENAREIRWTGLDTDAVDVRSARALGPYETTLIASADAIPLRDSSQDVVFSNSALEHMSGLSDVLSEAGRVLRTDGILLFTVPLESLGPNLLGSRTLRTLGLQSAAKRYQEHIYRRTAFENPSSPEEWLGAVETAGFRIEESVRYLRRREVAVWEAVSNVTGGAAYLLARGKQSPREIQRRMGIASARKGWPGRLAFFLMVPAVLLMGTGSSSRNLSGLLVVARNTRMREISTSDSAGTEAGARGVTEPPGK